MPIVEVEPSSSQNVKEELQVRIKEEISDTDESNYAILYYTFVNLFNY